nr:MAG TPA: hypothetical protein [Caudoviricetes sp.]
MSSLISVRDVSLLYSWIKRKSPGKNSLTFN